MGVRGTRIVRHLLPISCEQPKVKWLLIEIIKIISWIRQIGEETSIWPPQATTLAVSDTNRHFFCEANLRGKIIQRQTTYTDAVHCFKVVAIRILMMTIVIIKVKISFNRGRKVRHQTTTTTTTTTSLLDNNMGEGLEVIFRRQVMPHEKVTIEMLKMGERLGRTRIFRTSR